MSWIERSMRKGYTGDLVYARSRKEQWWVEKMLDAFLNPFQAVRVNIAIKPA